MVVATHPHQALAMLAEPTAAQREVLAAMPYTRNTAQLHTDTRVLPRRRRARASWNYLAADLRRAAGAGAAVTYDLTRLQRLPVTGDGTFLVTLGGQDLVDQSKVLDTMEYEHPLYTPESVAAQRRLPECDTDRWCSPAPGTAGASTRTAPARASRRPRTARRRVGCRREPRSPPTPRRAGDLREHDPPHPP